MKIRLPSLSRPPDQQTLRSQLWEKRRASRKLKLAVRLLALVESSLISSSRSMESIEMQSSLRTLASAVHVITLHLRSLQSRLAGLDSKRS